jgi:hypothetical protein
LPVAPIGKPQPTEYKVEGFKLKDLFAERFVELLESKVSNVKFEHVCLVKLSADEREIADRLIIGHAGREEEKSSIITMGARKPDTCEKLLEAISTYLEEKINDEGE